MASLIEAIDVKRKMFFEYETAPYHCLDVEGVRPTARGGQTLVRIKMRNLITRAVLTGPSRPATSFPSRSRAGHRVLPVSDSQSITHGPETYETLTLGIRSGGEDRISSSTT
jgi:elongation factor P